MKAASERREHGRRRAPTVSSPRTTPSSRPREGGFGARTLARTFGGLALDTAQAIAVEWYPPQVETADLQMDRDKATTELFQAGLLSLRQALVRLHPDWTEDLLVAEEAAIRGAAPAVGTE